MRLLTLSASESDSGGLEYRVFEGSAIPSLAALSHRWTDDEPTFKDIGQRTGTAKSGYAKAKGAMLEAKNASLEYIWVDTCCIDKSSSAELSEAINSMWTWYQNPSVCFVYLADVSATIESSPSNFDAEFCRSEWFTRGWTLQELVAPRKVEFYDQDWVHLGDSHDAHLRDFISRTTGIDTLYLDKTVNLSSASIAKRMSWAVHRKTTRLEDIAYCMMGSFSVNMPLLYGEGQRAFLRLQEEIIKSSDDQSIFAWCDDDAPEHITHGLFADSPEQFQHSRYVVTHYIKYRTADSFAMTNRGIRIRLGFEGTLQCQFEDREGLVRIQITSIGDGRYPRINLANRERTSNPPSLCFDTSEPMLFPQTWSYATNATSGGNRCTDIGIRLSQNTLDDGVYQLRSIAAGLHPWSRSGSRCETAGRYTLHRVPKSQSSSPEVSMKFRRVADRSNIVVLLGSINEVELGFAATDNDADSLFRTVSYTVNRVQKTEQVPKSFTESYTPIAINSSLDVREKHRVTVRQYGVFYTDDQHPERPIRKLVVDISALDEVSDHKWSLGNCCDFDESDCDHDIPTGDNCCAIM